MFAPQSWQIIEWIEKSTIWIHNRLGIRLREDKKNVVMLQKKEHCYVEFVGRKACQQNNNNNNHNNNNLIEGRGPKSRTKRQYSCERFSLFVWKGNERTNERRNYHHHGKANGPEGGLWEEHTQRGEREKNRKEKKKLAQKNPTPSNKSQTKLRHTVTLKLPPPVRELWACRRPVKNQKIPHRNT